MENQNTGSSTSIEATKIKTLYAIITSVILGDESKKITEAEEKFISEFENGKCWVGYNKRSLSTFSECYMWSSLNAAENAVSNILESLSETYPNLRFLAGVDSFEIEAETSHLGGGCVGY